jgi:hypothetical protein
VLEKDMYNKLSHVHTKNIPVPVQFGFSKGISTENKVFKLADSILKVVNQKMRVGRIFCDLAKVYNCINHEIFLTKLHFYGIQGTAANWPTSHLTNRKQEVVIKPSGAIPIFFSKWGTVMHGVHQRSILGPLLFITYINGLPLTIRNL